jgi:hypothetical protein
MAAGATYTPLATYTISGTQGDVTFTSFSGYTDLILVTQPLVTLNTACAIRFNSDSGTNYSNTVLYGSGTSAASYYRSDSTSINDINARINDSMGIIHIMNYSNSTTYKTVLYRSDTVSGSELNNTVGMWRSTAAITSITCSAAIGGTTFKTGATFTLYGIAAA